MNRRQAIAKARELFGPQGHAWGGSGRLFKVGFTTERRRNKFDSRNLRIRAVATSYEDCFAYIAVEKFCIASWGLNWDMAWEPDEVEPGVVSGPPFCKVVRKITHAAFADPPGSVVRQEVARGVTWQEVLEKLARRVSATPTTGETP